jgi:secondary thiamine-phosphate synthase enzyme
VAKCREQATGEGTLVTQSIQVSVRGQGLNDITSEVKAVVNEAGRGDGICHLFIQHTSASLLIQENYDPSARADLEAWLNRLVPENDPIYTHTLEGPDDMPAHIKAALTATSLAIPIVDGELALGTWQGIFLWEHRHHAGHRRVLVHVSP